MIAFATWKKFSDDHWCQMSEVLTQYTKQYDNNNKAKLYLCTFDYIKTLSL